VKGKWHGDGEDGGDLGLVEVHSVTYHHGKDQDGYLEEEHVGGFLAILTGQPTIHT